MAKDIRIASCKPVYQTVPLEVLAATKILALVNLVRKIELKTVFYSNYPRIDYSLLKKTMNKAKKAAERSNTKINHLGTLLNFIKASSVYLEIVTLMFILCE
jgi:hypothetical protein